MKKLYSSLAGSLFVLSLINPSQAGMGDDPLLGKFMLDKLETTDADGDSPINWEVDAWVGKDLNKVWLKSTGERIDGTTEQSNELLYSRAITPFWDMQLGYRQDQVATNERDFATVGFKGLAPYLFESDVSLIFGEADQLGLSASFEYELMLTQRWVLSPEIELSFWSENDPEMGVGSGLSEAELGLRLGYEIWREFMPYIGLSWSKKFSNTADFATEEGEDIELTLFVAGFRVWF